MENEDEIMLINSDGIIIRISAGEVSELGRATQGVKIMRVAEDANIISMTKVIREDGEEKADEGKDEGKKEEEAQLTIDTEK